MVCKRQAMPAGEADKLIPCSVAFSLSNCLCILSVISHKVILHPFHSQDLIAWAVLWLYVGYNSFVKPRDVFDMMNVISCTAVIQLSHRFVSLGWQCAVDMTLSVGLERFGPMLQWQAIAVVCSPTVDIVLGFME
jgi:hypothetical protein